MACMLCMQIKTCLRRVKLNAGHKGSDWYLELSRKPWESKAKVLKMFIDRRRTSYQIQSDLDGVSLSVKETDELRDFPHSLLV